jgi:hypothetical protein
MPHNLYWEKDGVYWKYYGVVSGKEVVETSTSIYGDQRFDTLKYKLVDFLDAERLDMGEDEIALIAFQHRSVERSNPYIKTAIVMRPVGVDMARKFASYFTESFWDVRIFHDRDEANKWLGRTPQN